MRHIISITRVHSSYAAGSRLLCSRHLSLFRNRLRTTRNATKRKANAMRPHRRLFVMVDGHPICHFVFALNAVFLLAACTHSTKLHYKTALIDFSAITISARSCLCIIIIHSVAREPDAHWNQLSNRVEGHTRRNVAFEMTFFSLAWTVGKENDEWVVKFQGL